LFQRGRNKKKREKKSLHWGLTVLGLAKNKAPAAYGTKGKGKKETSFLGGVAAPYDRPMQSGTQKNEGTSTNFTEFGEAR